MLRVARSRTVICPTSFHERQLRRDVEFDGFGVLADGTTFGLTVLNLSYDGCKVRTELTLMPGIPLRISILGLGRAVEAAVVWHKSGCAGLLFAPEDEEEESQTPRSYDRIEVAAEVSLRRNGRQHYIARLFDLTPKGCRVEFVERPRCGETVWAKLDGFDSIEATVRWVDGFYGGLEFVRPIYPSVFDLLLARLKA
jgi:hypothetical protein